MAYVNINDLKSVVTRLMELTPGDEWEQAELESVREYVNERDGILTKEEETYIENLGYWKADVQQRAFA